MHPALLIPLIVIVIVVAVVFGHLAAKKRREALAALAAELGWRFDPARDRDHDDEYEQFEIFRRGYGRVAFNTLSGDLEVGGHACRAKAGDFRYKRDSGSGKNRSTKTYNFSYLIVHLPFHTPALLIRPEGFFDKMAGAFGFDDIDFESAQFSRDFFVKSSDKRFAYDVIDARMMEFLLESKPPMIDIEHGACCLGGGARRWQPEQFKTEIGFLQRFFKRWPEHVIADLAASSGASH